MIVGILSGSGGDRYGWVTDAFGHVWTFTEVREVLTPQQIESRMHTYIASSQGTHE